MVGCYIAILDSQRSNQAIPQGNTWCPVPVDPRKSRRRNMDIDFLCCGEDHGPHPMGSQLSYSKLLRWGNMRCFQFEFITSFLLFWNWYIYIYIYIYIYYINEAKPLSLATHLSHQQRQEQRGHLEGCQLFPHVRQHSQDRFTFWSRGQTSQRKNAPTWLWLRTVHTRWWYNGITNSKKKAMGSGTTFQASQDLLISHASPAGELGIAIGDASSYPLVVELLARNAEPHQQMRRDPAQLHSSVPGDVDHPASRLSRYWQPTSYVIKTYLNKHFTSFLQHEINQSFWSIPDSKFLAGYFFGGVFPFLCKAVLWRCLNDATEPIGMVAEPVRRRPWASCEPCQEPSRANWKTRLTCTS